MKKTTPSRRMKRRPRIRSPRRPPRRATRTSPRKKPRPNRLPKRRAPRISDLDPFPCATKRSLGARICAGASGIPIEKISHNGFADLGAAGHYGMGTEHPGGNLGPDPVAVARALATAGVARLQHPRPGSAADRGRGAADGHARREYHWPAPGRHLGSDAEPDSGCEVALLERQTGFRHAAVILGTGIPQGAAGAVSARRILDHCLSDRSAG